ncbi:hypothetical protein C8J56DRAFT_545297 [Mycena floridula]|nr:hypothetical protein C8J56DRAFT_545297 [Mycena floridula]
MLRKYYRLVSVATLDEGEDCPICLDPMKVEECSSLRCGHQVCSMCLAELTDDDNQAQCPNCREYSEIRETEIVKITEVDRWDKLTALAQNWVAFDQGLGEAGDEAQEDPREDADATRYLGFSIVVNQCPDTFSSSKMGTITEEEEPLEQQEESSTEPSESNHDTKKRKLQELVAERARRKRHK